MNIKDKNWDKVILYLSRPNNLITALKVYSQVLIHSNLFDSKINQHGRLKDITLSEMAKNKHKKPFVTNITHTPSVINSQTDFANLATIK